MGHGAEVIDEKALKAAMRRFIQLRVNEAFLEAHGAHAVSISRRIKGGQATGDLVLVLHVIPGLKPPPGQQPVATPIDSPISFTDPDTGTTTLIPTDVIEEQSASLHGGAWRPSATSPVAGGMSCAPEPKPGLDHLIGTIGGWVWDLDEDRFVAISNMHVFGEAKGSAVYHPDYSSRILFGEVERFSPDATDTSPFVADCAIVVAGKPKRADFQVPPVGPAVMAAANADEKDKVEKVGSKTNHTLGVVTNDAWSGMIEDPRSGIKRLFQDCLYVKPVDDPPWTQGGDSGSLVFLRERSANGGSKPVVGLHIAGDKEDVGTYGIACRIENVFTRLRLTTLPHGMLRVIAKQSLGDLPPGATAAMRLDRDAEVEALVRLMIEFAADCREAEKGIHLMALLDQAGPELFSMFAQSGSLRGRAARIIRAVFFGRGQLSAVLAAPLTKGILDELRQAMTAIKAASQEDAGDLVDDLRKVLPRSGTTMTIGQFLASDSP